MISSETATNYNNDQFWKIDDNEIAFLSCKEDRILASTNPKKLCIPSLMASPDKPLSTYPLDKRAQLNPSIYCNDKECRPVVSGSIGTRNYITVFHHDNDWFRHKWLNRGAEIMIDIRNGDIDHLRITDKVDRSYCDDCLTEHPPCPHTGK